MTSPHSILVTDGEQRAALAVVRSLGCAGYHPYVCSTRPRSLAGVSRYAAGQFVTPDPLREPERFAHEVVDACRSRGVDVLLPIAEPALLALLPQRQLLDTIRLPFPEEAAFRRITDKASVMAAAARIGIAVPEQLTITSLEEASTVSVADLSFPVVLKPSRSVGEVNGERMKVGVSYAADAADFRAKIARLPRQAFPLLVQQRVVGPGVGVFLLTWKGERVAVFSHRRIREKPPSGGVSVYRESIPADPRLVDLSSTLLTEFDWEGVAMVEYKVDAATGTPYLMEINGRFWGSLQLAVDAGVDFPRLLIECALGRHVPPVTRYRAGVRSRWWWGDVDHLVARLRRGRDDLLLPPDSPGLVRTLGDFLTLWRPGDRNEIFHFDDPLPAVRETLNWVRGR